MSTASTSSKKSHTEKLYNTTTTTTTLVTLPPPSPPEAEDGGTRAWLQVVGSFLVFGNLWGFTFAFGSFQSYYSLIYLPASSASDISWIGTVSTFLLIMGGIVSGPLFDLGYFRSMLLVGAVMETLGVFLTSLCGKVYWQLFLTQGVLMGLGNALLYLPGLALVGRNFRKNRAVAMGIISCGAPTGGVIYTLIFEQLIERQGFANTVRIMGYVMLGSYIVSFPLLLWGVRNLGDIGSGTTRRLIDPSAFRNVPWWVYSFSNFFLFTGYMVPFFYMPTYGETIIHISRSFALYVTMIAQASSIVGRLCASLSASHIGVMIPWIICGLASGVLSLAWSGCKSVGGFVTFAALYGAFSGALIPLSPSVFPIVCPDPRVLGTRLGMAQAIGSVASLIGSPIAGAISETGGGEGRNYLGLQLFAGLVMVLGAGNLVFLWVLLIRRSENGKLI
ncbi:MFS general substrate transporter [Polychaeton citri CBS 116435]|uniref:MFS general substrate transporter n=1 Tax=Polychaeton citri CBS 116435 TaxID=1314669 RepID=A0A9P4Q8A6_9PEZI|nr:MFS general substrate transporter [Polychaeton citri CBS 116435]